ncbi:MAG: site-2 protease family protein [Planctomycetia bacterium]|nr:site-2 protease family protein [Planctomycetia bacterium]
MWKYDENGNWILVADAREENPRSEPYYPPLQKENSAPFVFAKGSYEEHDQAPRVPSEFARWKKPLIFYLLTWLSTTWIGSMMYGSGTFLSGLWFSVPLMIILTAHELGHYFQSRRYRVGCSPPLFIPVPLPPFGTFGAVIRMDARIPNVKALYDIGISGPLAGLVPTLVFMIIGIALSSVEIISLSGGSLIFGEPLLFRWVSMLFFDRSIPGTDLILHPIGMAAWTGLFITSLNLFPMGQLDGGHVFYALLKRKAAWCSLILFSLIVFLVIFYEQWNWSLMILLVMFFGIEHPPTCDDSVALGLPRKVLGWLTLAFILIGFTPNPISEQAAPPKKEAPRSKTIYSIRENPEYPVFSFCGSERGTDERF